MIMDNVPKSIFSSYIRAELEWNNKNNNNYDNNQQASIPSMFGFSFHPSLHFLKYDQKK